MNCPRSKVILENGYIIHEKRRDGRVAAYLFYRSTERGQTRKRQVAELIADDAPSLDQAIVAWAEEHAINFSELEAAA